MHEWMLAKDAISTVLKLADEKNAKRVSAFKIKVGELQQVDREAFELALKELSKGTKAEGSRVVVEFEKAEFKCNSCGREWGLSGNEFTLEDEELIHLPLEVVQAHLRCPSCGRSEFHVKGARDLLIDFVEMKFETEGPRPKVEGQPGS